LKPDLVNYYSHLLVLRYALNAVHAFYIRPDGIDVKKKKIIFVKIIYTPRASQLLLIVSLAIVLVAENEN